LYRHWLLVTLTSCLLWNGRWYLSLDCEIVPS
jgi:hypothetical protein